MTPKPLHTPAPFALSLSKGKHPHLAHTEPALSSVEGQAKA
jgi:hypothetical protein